MELLAIAARFAMLGLAAFCALRLTIRLILLPVVDRLIAEASDAEEETESPREP